MLCNEQARARADERDQHYQRRQIQMLSRNSQRHEQHQQRIKQIKKVVSPLLRSSTSRRGTWGGNYGGFDLVPCRSDQERSRERTAPKNIEPGDGGEECARSV